MVVAQLAKLGNKEDFIQQNKKILQQIKAEVPNNQRSSKKSNTEDEEYFQSI